MKRALLTVATLLLTVGFVRCRTARDVNASTRPAGSAATHNETAPVPLAAPSARVRAAVNGDVNGDGISDVLVSSGALGAQLYLGSRSGLSRTPSLRLDHAVASPGRVVATAVALVDLSGDRRAELVVGEATERSTHETWRCPRGRVRIFRANPGATEAAEAARIEAPAGFARFGTSVRSLGDLDGDGDEELLVLGMRANEGTRRVRTARSSTDQLVEFCSSPAWFMFRGGSGAVLEPIATPRMGARAIVDRVDTDRHPDLLTYHMQLLAYRGTASGFASDFTLLTPEENTSRVDLAAGDLDGDGSRDVVLTRAPGASGGVATLFFGPFAPQPTDGDAGAVTSVELSPRDADAADFNKRAVVVADFNGDGLDDAVVGDAKTRSVLLFFGVRGRAFGAPITIAGPPTRHQGFGSYLAIAGDVNGDGSPEVLAPLGGLDEGPETSALWVFSPRAGAPQGVLLEPEEPRPGFAFAVAGRAGVEGENRPAAPPIPRVCTVNNPAALVTFAISEHPEQVSPRPGRPRIALRPLPADEQRSILATLPGAPLFGIVVCNANRLARDCNSEAQLFFTYEGAADGQFTLSSSGGTGISNDDEILNCVTRTLPTPRPARPPAGTRYGFALRVGLAAPP